MTGGRNDGETRQATSVLGGDQAIAMTFRLMGATGAEIAQELELEENDVSRCMARMRERVAREVPGAEVLSDGMQRR